MKKDPFFVHNYSAQEPFFSEKVLLVPESSGETEKSVLKAKCRVKKDCFVGSRTPKTQNRSPTWPVICKVKCRIKWSIINTCFQGFSWIFVFSRTFRVLAYFHDLSTFAGFLRFWHRHSDWMTHIHGIHTYMADHSTHTAHTWQIIAHIQHIHGRS